MNQHERSINEILQSLPEDLHLEERLVKYMADNVNKTFEDIQKSTREVLEYLSIVNASDKYVEAVIKVDALMEVIRELIQEYIDNSTVENQRKHPQPHKRINKVTKKMKPTKQQNKKVTKTLNCKRESKPEKKMNANQKNVEEIAIDKLDKTKFEVSIIEPEPVINKNLRRSQRVKYPPINEWAGEKLIQLHDGSYALIKCKTSIKPELITENKRSLAQREKKRKLKRLQKKGLQENKKNLSARTKSKSNGGRRTLYSPTMWMDSLISNPDLFYAYETDDGNNSLLRNQMN